MSHDPAAASKAALNKARKAKATYESEERIAIQQEANNKPIDVVRYDTKELIEPEAKGTP